MGTYSEVQTSSTLQAFTHRKHNCSTNFKMTVIQTLLYPKGSQDFDMDYYLNKHMQMVQKAWQNSSAGLQKWQIVKLDPSSGYVTKAVLTWDSKDKVDAAFASEDGKKILGDIPNYCNVKPEVHAGEVIGEH